MQRDEFGGQAYSEASGWKQLIAARDRCVNRIYELQREIVAIDEVLEKNPPPPERCVGVWQPKKKAVHARIEAA